MKTQVIHGMKRFFLAMAIPFLMYGCNSIKDADAVLVQPQARGGEKMYSRTISNQMVYSITQDRDGHIWLGTFRGLNRYDANIYTQYYSFDNETGLNDNHITSLFTDSRGRLWIATVDGACFYSDDDSFTRLHMTSRNRNITQIFESASGRIFMCSSTELLVCNEEGTALESAIPTDRFPAFATFFAGTDNTIWGVTSRKITGYDSETLNKLGEYDLPVNITCSAMASDGNLWICTSGGFRIFNTISRQFSEVSASLNRSGCFNHAAVYRLFILGDSHVLFCTIDRNIYLYYINEERLVHQDDKAFPFEIPHLNNITCIFRDSAHNIWFGTGDNGYFMAKRNNDIFTVNRKMQAAFSGEQVSSVITSLDGSVIIGATKSSGLITYNCLEDKRAVYEDINYDRVFCDSRGDIWTMHTMRNDICRYSLKNGRLRLEQRLDIPYIMAMTEDSNGILWMSGGGEYIYRYSHSDGKLNAVRAYSDNSFTFIPGIENLTDSTLFVSGFYRNPVILNTSSGKTDELEGAGEDFSRCIRRSVMIPTDIYKDSNGRVWIGTIANGLLCYTPETGRMISVEGGPCSDITAIEENEFGDLWISSLHGIGRLDSSSGKFTNFYFNNDSAMSGDQYYERSSCKMPDGTIIFGGTHGITCINSRAMSEGISLPLVFEDIKVHNDIIRPGEGSPIRTSLTSKPDVTLRHEENSFSIRYSLLDYAGAGRNHFYYWLEGYEDSWHDAESNTEAFYTGVGAGRYILHVKCEDDSGSVLPAEECLNIRVKPAPWATWWAILGYCLVVLFILSAFWNYSRQIKKVRLEHERAEQEKEQEKQLNRMHMDFFANVAHEFRTPLTTLTGPLSLLSSSESLDDGQKRLLSVIRKSSDRMMGLVNQFLDFNKLENDTLQLAVANHNLTEDLRKCAEIFEVTAKIKKISITKEGLDDDYYMVYDQDKLYKILSNLLSNAVKYTESGGMIRIGFYLDDGGSMARIFVADNGIGVPDELKEKIFERFYRGHSGVILGTGIGLCYAKALANVHHGSIVCTDNDQSENSKGTIFTVTLPASPASYSPDEYASDVSQSLQYPIEGPVDESEPSEERHGAKVLVVDDDPDICNYLKILLRAEDYIVKTCFDADSAFSCIKEWEPDIVLCDVSMPGKDGYALCQAVREDISVSHLPFILVSARTSGEDQATGLERGADAYITKPFDPKYLLAVIKAQFTVRQRIQQSLNKATDSQSVQEKDTLSLQDKAFLKELYGVMEEHITDMELDINYFAAALRISRTKLYYKVKGLTGQSPAAFFKNFKLNKAAEMICEGRYNFSEISDRMGFASLSHFSSSFKKHFGVSPSEYAKTAK